MSGFDWASIVLGVASLLVALALTYATWEYTKAARAQASATRDQAEAVRHRPYVFLGLDWRADTIVIENSGDRVALNISITVHQDFVTRPEADSESVAFLGKSHLASVPSAGLAPGQRIRESRGNRMVRRATRDDVIDFTISYYDADGHQYSERAQYSLGEVRDWLGGSPPVGVSQAERDAYERVKRVVDAIEGVRDTIRAVRTQQPQ